MSQDRDDGNWPAEAGDPGTLSKEKRPPAGLEDRVVKTLLDRGLLHAEASEHRPGWRAVRASLGAAAGLGLLAIGVLLGRVTAERTPAPLLSGAETDVYALLLYETEGYEGTTEAAARSRYDEYSAWVARARRRGQFVTGEDLDVGRGWRLAPALDGPAVAEATSLPAAAPLSGIFFVRARDANHALELARELPHLRHGGQVLVQKTLPTDTPPPRRAAEAGRATRSPCLARPLSQEAAWHAQSRAESARSSDAAPLPDTITTAARPSMSR